MSDPDRVYAVGDIHGHPEQLESALARIARDMRRHGPGEAVLLGDLVDRGPAARAVIERAMAWHDPAAGRHVIAGNHDLMFARFLRGQRDPHLRPGLDYWDSPLGGRHTLASYGVGPEASPEEMRRAANELVPEAHLAWIEALPLWVRRDPGGVPHLFVHAGVRPGVALEDQDHRDLVWIRGGFDDDARAHPWLVVHGHTVHDAATHYGNRVALDTGGGYGRAVTAAVFEAEAAHVLGRLGRRALPAPVRGGVRISGSGTSGAS